MKPQYLQAGHGNRDRWTISYVDVLTILLIFFVAAAAKIPAAPSPAPPPAPPPVEKSTLEIARETLAARGLDVRIEPRGLVVSLPQAILFASADDRVDAAALPEIEKIAPVIAGLPNHVILCGHADAAPIHSARFRSNWELSAARGLRLLELLTGKYNIPESRLSVSSDGANRPVASNETEHGRASNRRVEIVIVNEHP